MNGMVKDVEIFSNVFGKLVNEKPQMIPQGEFEFIRDFIQEELDEFEEAYREGNLIEIVDAFADIQYVLNAGILAFGFQHAFQEVFDEVQASNMSKSCATIEDAEKTIEVRSKEHGACHYEQQGDLYIVYRSSDRKVMKSVNYFRPNLGPIVSKYQK